MSTLSKIKRLSDGEFHRLGDELLRRLDTRYRQLRPYGLNERGESIVGQPDSYVGESPDRCTIAVQYTVQRNAWWNKVVSDVAAAVVISTELCEIVVIIPQNKDRDGPSRTKTDWLQRVREAARGVPFRLIDGPELARLLDFEYQDLRYEHLGIAYSRLTRVSILASAKAATQDALTTIRASGRYDPARYARRSADAEIFRLWQLALRAETASDGKDSVKLIALVDDSGVGKTSLVCAFVSALGTILPALLIQARDVIFRDEDSLVRYVMNALQGVLAPAMRDAEEAAIARNLAGTIPLTVILDGLDEAHDAGFVKRSITYWLRSLLGQHSVLLVTARPEYWKVCSDPGWKRWMPMRTRRGHSRDIADEYDCRDRNRQEEHIRLPGLLIDNELDLAWRKAGRNPVELYALHGPTRKELLHPFTLRVYLDLSHGCPPLSSTLGPTELMEMWLDKRLTSESSTDLRISTEVLASALKVFAKQMEAQGGSALSVDEIVTVPRFDYAHPPGAVVEQLIHANILESLPGRSDRIRFSNEAVADFYLAEAAIDDIVANPLEIAGRFARLSYTAAYPRLRRIGRRLKQLEIRHVFFDALAELSPAMAAAVLGCAPERYTPSARDKVVRVLAQCLDDRCHVRGASAITLLGDLNCVEAEQVLIEKVLRNDNLPREQKNVAATALAKLGSSTAAAFVYRWEWFGVLSDTTTHFMRDKLSLYRRISPELRDALAAHATVHLSAASGTVKHAKAIAVLAHLKSDCLAAHLSERLKENGVLCAYENQALMASGTDLACALFSRSIRTVAQRLDLLSDMRENERERSDLYWSLIPIFSDSGYLVTPALEYSLHVLLECGSVRIAGLAGEIARRLGCVSLVYSMASALPKSGWLFWLNECEIRRQVTPELWLSWWHMTNDSALRGKLLAVTPLYPSADIEETLLQCLDEETLRSSAARALGGYGSVRAAPALRRLLGDEQTEVSLWDKHALAHALGDLRDPDAVYCLGALVAAHGGADVGGEASISLGLIGTPAAEKTLRSLLETEGSRDVIWEGLFAHGSRTAIDILLQEARNRDDGISWLGRIVRMVDLTRGWTAGAYKTGVGTSDLVRFLEERYETASQVEKWSIVHAMERFDNPDIRLFLQRLMALRGTPEDAVLREDDQLRMSWVCSRELANRGDESAIPHVFDDRSRDREGSSISEKERDLQRFASAAVAAEVCKRLTAADQSEDVAGLLYLLGRFGDQGHVLVVQSYLDHSDDSVANAACVALLRLSDPLLLPDSW